MIAPGAGYVIASGAPKVIASGAAKGIRSDLVHRPNRTCGLNTSFGFRLKAVANRRTNMHRLQELVRLHRMGIGAREVARLLGMSPNTERAYRSALKSEGLLHGSEEELPALAKLRAAIFRQRPPPAMPSHEVSSVEEWRPRIETLVAKGLTARPIFDRLLQEEEDFSGSYWAVKRLCRRIRASRGIQPHEVAIPVETMAGDIAQVDFGYAGKLVCPETHVPRRAWVFVLTLGYSRHMYAEVVFDQKSTTWVALHMRAFKALGGVPRTLVPDNLKAAVIRTAFKVDGDSELNRSYRELARYYGFKIDPTPPRAPRKKGKVESSVKYVKNNALAGRDGEALDAVNRALSRWVEEIAGTRVHGTTGKAPLHVFQLEERSSLLALPEKPYEVVVWKKAKVHQDTHLVFDGRLYSAPWTYIGQSLWVRATPSTVAILNEKDERIVTHSRRGKGKRVTVEAHLPEHRRDLRHRSQTYWEDRAANIGPETATLAKAIFDADDVLSQLRKVQSIVTHLEDFPKERAEAASKRAFFYGTFSYRGVKRILSQALDLQPLPSAFLMPAHQGRPPRFARNLDELLAARLEVSDEPN